MDTLDKLLNKAANAENPEPLLDDNELRSIIGKVPQNIFFTKYQKGIKMSIGAIITVAALWFAININEKEAVEFTQVNEKSEIQIEQNTQTQKEIIQQIENNDLIIDEKEESEPQDIIIGSGSGPSTSINAEPLPSSTVSFSGSVQADREIDNVNNNIYTIGIDDNFIPKNSLIINNKLLQNLGLKYALPNSSNSATNILNINDLDSICHNIIELFPKNSEIKQIMHNMYRFAFHKLDDDYHKEKYIGLNKIDNMVDKTRFKVFTYILEKLTEDISGIKNIKLNKTQLKQLGIYFTEHNIIDYINNDSVRDIPILYFYTVEKYKTDRTDKKYLEFLKSKNYEIYKDEMIIFRRKNLYLNPSNGSIEYYKSNTVDPNEIESEVNMHTTPVGMQFSQYFGYGSIGSVICSFENIVDDKIKYETIMKTIMNSFKDSISKDSEDITDFLIPLHISYGLKNYPVDESTRLKYEYNEEKVITKRLFDINYAECTLWYYPTEEFMEALPEDIEKQLRKELELIHKIKQGEISDEEACEILKGEESLLGMCEMFAESYKDLKVFPNPNSGNEINLSFLNLSDSNVIIQLHDSNGNFLADIHNSKLKKGIQELKFDISDFENGLYILNITNEKADNAYIKFVINR